jgi:hypothetical protein
VRLDVLARFRCCECKAGTIASTAGDYVPSLTGRDLEREYDPQLIVRAAYLGMKKPAVRFQARQDFPVVSDQIAYDLQRNLLLAKTQSLLPWLIAVVPITVSVKTNGVPLTFQTIHLIDFAR